MHHCFNAAFGCYVAVTLIVAGAVVATSPDAAALHNQEQRQVPVQPPTKPPPKRDRPSVLIIGSGINGAAAAYLIQALASENRCSDESADAMRKLSEFVSTRSSSSMFGVDKNPVTSCASVKCGSGSAESGPPVDITIAEASDTRGGRIKELRYWRAAERRQQNEQSQQDVDTAAENEDSADNVIELGASVYHTVNHYMSYFAESLTPAVLGSLGVFPKKAVDAPESEPRKETGSSTRTRPYLSSKVGVWDGTQFAFKEHATSTILNAVGGLWRYGLSPFRIRSCVDALVDRLLRIYAVQLRERRSFERLDELLAHIDLLGSTQRNMTAYFLECAGVRETHPFVQEIAHSLTRINYGQGLELSALAGGVAMKGRGDEVFGVRGGNRRVVEALITAAWPKEMWMETRVDVTLEETLEETLEKDLVGGDDDDAGEQLSNNKKKTEEEVREIPRQSRVLLTKTWHKKREAIAQQGTQPHDTRPKSQEPFDALSQFDAVVIAHPRWKFAHEGEQQRIDRKDAAVMNDITPPLEGQTTHVTIVRSVTPGCWNISHFGVASAKEMPTVVTTSVAARHNKYARTFFRSAGRLKAGATVSSDIMTAAEDDDCVFKVFADAEPTQAELETVFGKDCEIVLHHVWNAAYPVLTPRVSSGESSNQPPNFVLVNRTRARPLVVYAGALEGVVSTMETQCIGAMNAALIVHKALRASFNLGACKAKPDVDFIDSPASADL